MKRSITCLLLAASSALAAPNITIGDLKLFRAFAPPDSKSELREYVPAGESLERWNRLASVRIFKDLKDPRAYLRNVAAAVNRSHPFARHAVYQDQKTKELVLDFMTFAPASSGAQFAEWNLMRAEYVKGIGLFVYQYAMRVYDLSDAAAKVKAERAKMLAPFGLAAFEEENEPN